MLKASPLISFKKEERKMINSLDRSR